MSVQISFASVHDMLQFFHGVGPEQVVTSLQKLEKQMATTQDNIAKLTADFNAAAKRVNDDLTALNGQIATLQQQVQTLQDAAGNADTSPEVQAAIDALDTSINALDVPAPVTPATPTPTPLAGP